MTFDIWPCDLERSLWRSKVNWGQKIFFVELDVPIPMSQKWGFCANYFLSYGHFRSHFIAFFSLHLYISLYRACFGLCMFATYVEEFQGGTLCHVTSWPWKFCDDLDVDLSRSQPKNSQNTSECFLEVPRGHLSKIWWWPWKVKVKVTPEKMLRMPQNAS